MADVMTRFEVKDQLGLMLMWGDWQFEPPDLLTDEGPETAVLLSLFTDGLAGPDDVLPDHLNADRRGWWADTNAPEGPLGSKLWLLAREKTTEDTRQRAEQYCRDALQWMISDDAADVVTVEATWNAQARGRLDIDVFIYREARLIWSKSYPMIWAAVQRGAV
jgi:phage gp46-like protein